MTSNLVRWVGLAVATLLVSGIARSTRAGEPSGEGGEQARTATDSAGGGAETVLRSPGDVRKSAVAFSGDLSRIDTSRARQLLRDVCPGTLEKADDRTWQCGRCPGFTSRAGQEGALQLEQTIRGDFFRKNRTEIFASYRGCEAEHAAGGGAIVFRRHKKEWQAFYRHPGLNPQQCLVFKADKHPDRLVCRVRSRANGRIMDHVYDTGGDGDMRRLVHAIDNTAKCPDHKFISSYLADWDRSGGENGQETLVIEKIQRWRKLGDKRKSVCSLSEAGGAWKRHRRLEIVYRFDGEGLERTEVRKQSITAEGTTKTASTVSESDEETKTD
ncbi:MAG: hypothetical protein ABEN55_22170 [Bradymonadaceae bacterium]